MAVSRRSGDEIHPWVPNGDLRPGPVVHGRCRECRLSDREPVVQLQRTIRLLIAIYGSQRMRERPGSHLEKAFKKDFLGDCRQTSKTRQRLIGLSGGSLDTTDATGPTERARSVVWHRARRLLP